MDASEATKIVMSRIRSLDPENASKIMGYTLIQDQGEKEMIRLAFSPDTLLQSHVDQAKARLGLSSNRDAVFTRRIMVPNNGFHLSNPSSPVAPPFRSCSSPRPPLSYAAVLDTPNNSGSGSPSLHFYGGGSEEFFSGGGQEQLLFHDGLAVDPIMSPGGRRESLVFPYDDDAGCIPSSPHLDRRSDAAFVEEGGNDDGGVVWRPCVYFARGFCKNGSNCNFLHSGEGIEELLRMKTAIQHQRFALMASGVGHYPFGYKCLNGNLRGNLLHGASSSARQIYLTFPADSTFKEQDVSNYFSMFGPVQDVRIPYQQKRMFGFVTFVYPETVKLILAKGNPHFLCDCRVLVKPYKEKGKIQEKKQQQQSERVEYSCLSPTGVDSRENFDGPFPGSGMATSPRDELQNVIELQGRRMMNLGLLSTENESCSPLFIPSSFPSSIPYLSPTQVQFLMNQGITASDFVNHHDSEAFAITELNSGQAAPSTVEGTESPIDNNIIKTGNQLLYQPNADGSNLPKSLEDTSASEVHTTPIATAPNNTPALTGSSALTAVSSELP